MDDVNLNFNARDAARLTREALEAVAITESQLLQILQQIADSCAHREQSLTTPVDAKYRLALVRELRERGFNARVMPGPRTRKTVELLIEWPDDPEQVTE